MIRRLVLLAGLWMAAAIPVAGMARHSPAVCDEVGTGTLLLVGLAVLWWYGRR